MKAASALAVVTAVLVASVISSGAALAATQVQLTNFDVNFGQPISNPAGTLITMYGGNPGEYAIYTIRPDGTGLQSLTPVGAYPPAAQTSTFSRDGNYIFYSYNPGTNWQIWKMNVDGTNQTHLSTYTDRAEALPNELPDGRIVFQTWAPTWSISVMNADGTGRTALPNVVPDGLQPRVSPNGRYVVYNSQDSTVNDIYLYDLATDTNTRLTYEAASQGFPSFSPDGNWIAYMSKEDGGAFYDIWVMDLAGGNRRQITFEDFNQEYPSFMPNGDILFTSNQDGGAYFDIWKITNPLNEAVPEPTALGLLGFALLALNRRRS